MPQILIIDDDPTIRLTLQKVLQRKAGDAQRDDRLDDGFRGMDPARRGPPSV